MSLIVADCGRNANARRKSAGRRCGIARIRYAGDGEVREWLNRAVSKTVELVRFLGFEFPPSPPE